MKKLITILLVLCLVAIAFTGCARDKDRAENNGIVTDDTSNRTTTDKTTTDRKDADDGGNILDDAGNAVSDVVEGATDAVDDMLGGGAKDTRDTSNTSTNRMG